MEQNAISNSNAPEQVESAKSGGGLKSWFALIVIVVSIAIGTLIYLFVFGASSNFDKGDTNNHPVAEMPGKLFGLMYKGGILVPVALGLLIMLIAFIIERSITLARAQGTGDMELFVHNVQTHLSKNDVDGAMALCDVQKGTIGNVVKEVLKKYKEQEANKSADKEARVLSIQKSLEESIALELPMLEKHLVIIATIVSIATLVGLIGTVIGMIKAFSALANTGAPDASALATGISEALINTALGITTSTIATIVYNYFTSSIDGLTYRVDEAGYSIVQTFAEKN